MTPALAMVGNVAETSLARFFHSARSCRNGRTTDPFRWTGRRGGSVETGRALRGYTSGLCGGIAAVHLRCCPFTANPCVEKQLLRAERYMSLEPIAPARYTVPI